MGCLTWTPCQRVQGLYDPSRSRFWAAHLPYLHFLPSCRKISQKMLNEHLGSRHSLAEKWGDPGPPVPPAATGLTTAISNVMCNVRDACDAYNAHLICFHPQNVQPSVISVHRAEARRRATRDVVTWATAGLTPASARVSHSTTLS